MACHVDNLRVRIQVGNSWDGAMYEYESHTLSSEVFEGTVFPAVAIAIQCLGGLACILCYMFAFIRVKRCTVGVLMVLAIFIVMGLTLGLIGTSDVPYCHERFHSCGSKRAGTPPSGLLLLTSLLLWLLVFAAWPVCIVWLRTPGPEPEVTVPAADAENPSLDSAVQLSKQQELSPLTDRSTEVDEEK